MGMSHIACRVSLCVALCALCGLAVPARAEATPQHRLVVAIPDYLQTNGVVSARRNMTEALIKAGKIKKQKPLPEISEDEVPFEIPGFVRAASASQPLHR